MTKTLVGTPDPDDWGYARTDSSPRLSPKQFSMSRYPEPREPDERDYDVTYEADRAANRYEKGMRGGY